MSSIVPIVSILLALIAAGCIAYVAWELTSEENTPGEPDESEPPGSR
jgi:hypothetical protein